MTIIIYPPTIDWSFMRQRPQHLMMQFAKDNHTVLYFNKENKPGKVWSEVENNLFTINHAQFFMDKILPKLEEDKLYWTSWSKKIPFAKECNADFLVYDCVDDFPDWDDDEKRWIHEVDTIVCTAMNLKEKMKKIAPEKPVTLAPNGCDWEFFHNSQFINMDNLDGVPFSDGPKIGYIGAWAPWVDKEIISKLADTYPHGQIIIIGPMLTSELVNKSNVYYLGYRDYSDLPAILAYFDICIIPFELNRITESTNPIKVYEYLAAGKPVVSTNLPEVKKMIPFVDVAETHNQFLSYIAKALVYKRNPSYLSQYAKQFSWEERYRTIQQSLVNYFPAISKRGETQQLLNSISYHNDTFNLAHCTTNSYYPNINLKHDPPFIGQKPQGEYQCFLKAPKENIDLGSNHIYLDIDIGTTHSFTTLHVEINYTLNEIDFDKLTYSTKLDLHSFKSYNLKESINKTYSVDITELVKKLGAIPSFQLKSKNNNHIRLNNPRISIFKRTDEVSK
ncbi:glycosyltransferase [Sutcliffiella horikoshii]|uniref:glycosyltransferase n=1 Tax=Sutcliffiella horikoshii TaxID=79883 RepID=UPI00384AEC6B